MKKVWRVYGIKEFLVEVGELDIINNGDVLIKLRDFDRYEDADYYIRDTCLYTDYNEFTIKEVYIL